MKRTLFAAAFLAASLGLALAGEPQMQVGGASFKVPAPTVTIASGDATGLSTSVNLFDYRLFAIIMPGTWTAASLSFQVAVDCNTFGNLFNDAGTEVTVTTPLASQYVVMSSPGQWLGIGTCIKIRSGTSGSPVTQGGARVLTIVAVP